MLYIIIKIKMSEINKKISELMEMLDDKKEELTDGTYKRMSEKLMEMFKTPKPILYKIILLETWYEEERGDDNKADLYFGIRQKQITITMKQEDIKKHYGDSGDLYDLDDLKEAIGQDIKYLPSDNKLYFEIHSNETNHFMLTDEHEEEDSPTIHIKFNPYRLVGVEQL